MRLDLTQDESDDLVDAIAAQAQLQQEQSDAYETTSCCSSSSLHHLLYDTLGSTGIAILSCHAGQPLDCWKDFDAVLNLSYQEYPHNNHNNAGNYLKLAIQEGKQDKTKLECWMTVGLVFCVLHTQAR